MSGSAGRSTLEPRVWCPAATSGSPELGSDPVPSDREPFLCCGTSSPGEHLSTSEYFLSACVLSYRMVTHRNHPFTPAVCEGQLQGSCDVAHDCGPRKLQPRAQVMSARLRQLGLELIS